MAWNLIANAGTPLVWFGFVYPFVGATATATVESGLLHRFGLLKDKRVGWRPILLGNWITTLLGFVFVLFATPLADALLKPRPLEAANCYIVCTWIAAFLLTIAIESAFFAKAMECRWSSSKCWKATIACNGATYALLVLIAAALGRNTVGSEVRVVPIQDLADTNPGWVYYVESQSNRVQRVRLDGSQSQLTKFIVPTRDSIISIETIDGRHARLVSANNSEDVSVLIPHLGVAGRAALMTGQTQRPEFQSDHPNRRSFGYTFGRTLESPDRENRSNLKFDTFQMYWPELGLTFKQRSPKSTFSVAMGVPFLAWTWNQPTTLPDGRVVAGFGPQIVVVDIPTRKIAWLAAGRCPAVLLDKPVR